CGVQGYLGLGASTRCSRCARFFDNRYRRFGRQLLPGAHERVHDQRVVHDAATLNEYVQGIAVIHSWTVRSVGRERVKTIHYGQNSCADRNIGATNAVWVTSAIPVFVMVAHDRNNGVWKTNRRQDFG